MWKAKKKGVLKIIATFLLYSYVLSDKNKAAIFYPTYNKSAIFFFGR